MLYFEKCLKCGNNTFEIYKVVLEEAGVYQRCSECYGVDFKIEGDET